MIFDYIYGNLHRICVYNLDYSSIEKNHLVNFYQHDEFIGKHTFNQKYI